VAPEELDRDLGVALARVAARAGGAGVRPVLGRFARDRLAAALGRWGGDADAWHAMSLAHSACGDIDGRLEAAERAARLSGGSELALAEVAAAALDRGKLDRAEEAATAVVGQSPRSVPHLLTRAAVYFARGQWDRAEADCRAALAIHPLHPQARLSLAVCLHRRGDAPAGRREAETALGLVADPRQREAFRKMYERETR
jgi:tetratricopeptide (TPR) repeat protein